VVRLVRRRLLHRHHRAESLAAAVALAVALFAATLAEPALRALLGR